MTYHPQPTEVRIGVANYVGRDQINITNIDIESERAFEGLCTESVNGAAYDSGERHPPPKCHPGTRTGVLSRITKFISNTHKHRICWLSGMAGSGKSSIAYTIAERCKEQQRLAASFFFSRGKAGRSNADRLFQTIAFQLTVSVPPIKGRIVEAIRKDPSIFDKAPNVQWQQLVVKPLQAYDIPDSLPMVFVMDALDECDDEERVCEIIMLLSQEPLPFHILITSRPEQYISAQFRDPRVDAVTRSINLLHFDADDDIRCFLRSQFEVVHNVHPFMCYVPKPWPSDNDLSRMVELSSGLFVWASTALKFIKYMHDKPTKRLKLILDADHDSNAQASFAGLDQLYSQVLKAVNQENRSLLERVITTIVLLFDPLPVDGLETLIQLSTGDVLLVLQQLHSIIFVPNDKESDTPVRIFHSSLRDFYLDENRSNEHFIDAPKLHGVITRACLRILSEELKGCLRDRHDPELYGGRGKLTVDGKGDCKALRYACLYWTSHLSRAQPSELIENELKTFISKFLVDWLEVLSFIARFNKAVPSIQQVTEWMTENLPIPSTDLLGLMHSAGWAHIDVFKPGFSDCHSTEVLLVCVSPAAYREVDRVECRPGTCQDVRSSISEWICNPDDSLIYWLTGKAGSGKTCIAQTIARELDRDGSLAASFFFGLDYLGYGNHDSIHQFFPTIACQLAISVRQIVTPLIYSLSGKHSDYLKDGFDRDHPRVLITDPLRNVNIDEMIIVVDALDACDEGNLLARELLNLARSLREAKCPLRLLVTSRPVANIRDTFAGPEVKTISLDTFEAWDC